MSGNALRGETMEVQMTEAAPMQMCPMAGTCKAMMQRPFSGLALIIAGISFIALGLLVMYEPRSLFWILASCFVLVGAIDRHMKFRCGKAVGYQRRAKKEDPVVHGFAVTVLVHRWLQEYSKRRQLSAANNEGRYATDFVLKKLGFCLSLWQQIS